jgi:hypothetical protein
MPLTDGREGKHMTSLSETIADAYSDSYRDFARRVRALAGELSEEEFWVKPYPYGNSFGNLVLHLVGNLNYYVGAQIASSGYIRERELEFTESRLGRKDEVLKALDDAVDLVVQTLGAQSDDTWGAPYEAVGVDDVENRFGIYLRCAAHFHHHVGQMIYLANELRQGRPGARADISD